MQLPKAHFLTFSSETKIMKITHSVLVYLLAYITLILFPTSVYCKESTNFGSLSYLSVYQVSGLKTH